MNINDFDPDGVGVNNGNYFGFPFTPEEAELVIVSVPWDVTASFGGGASFGPDAIIEASTQIDYYDPMAPEVWRRGIATAGIDYSIQDHSNVLRPDAKKIMDSLEKGGTILEELLMPRKLEKINNASAELNCKLFENTKKYLDKNKVVGLVGGDHSTPLGLIKAVGQKEGGIGILHLDAHCDLRDAYEGFIYSHASIMYNVLNEIPEVEKIVQVAVRDFSSKEYRLAQSSPRITMFADHTLAERKFSGECWRDICSDIVSALPQKVYISFDIDVLSIENCHSTGTPVPGGLSYNEAVYLINMVAESGRTIVGFDLCEVSPGREDKLDANIGARILFKLCGITLKSRK